LPRSTGQPRADRWGGWYVTGRHGDQRHLGNLTFDARPATAADADPSGLNVTDLGDRFGPKGYLTGHSDLVALSVFAHQAAAFCSGVRYDEKGEEGQGGTVPRRLRATVP